MKTARLVVLGIAIAGGGVAAYLASGSDTKPVVAEAPPPLPTVDVLIAKSDIGLGQAVGADDMQWQSCPRATASNNSTRRSYRPEATTQIAGSIARYPFIAGEPIREVKLVKANGSGFMAAGFSRGIARGVRGNFPPTRAGGFILPNDRVDVILSRREKNPD